MKKNGFSLIIVLILILIYVDVHIKGAYPPKRILSAINDRGDWKIEIWLFPNKYYPYRHDVNIYAYSVDMGCERNIFVSNMDVIELAESEYSDIKFVNDKAYIFRKAVPDLYEQGFCINRHARPRTARKPVQDESGDKASSTESK